MSYSGCCDALSLAFRLSTFLSSVRFLESGWFLHDMTWEPVGCLTLGRNAFVDHPCFFVLILQQEV